MKKKFLWGSATAAYQCEGAWKEGGKGISNWDAFCHNEKNSGNMANGDVACDHYHRYEEDVKRMAEGGQNAYRFSIAWTRVLPDGTGEKSPEGIGFYNRLIDTCLKYGIEPFVTIYHYDLPQSIFEAGGWENRNTVDAYVQYAKVCFEEFGDRVNYWATINEPSYETLGCYGYGNYPPNKHSLESRWRAMYHMMLASAGAVSLYKKMGQEGMIGLVSDCYSIDYKADDEEYRRAADAADLFYNRSVNDVCVKGTYPKEFTDKLRAEGYDLSYMREEDEETLKAGCVDFLGVNAYCRYLVKPCTGKGVSLSVNNTGDGKKREVFIEGWFALDEDDGLEKTPWGMEIYPKSIYDLLISLKKRYPHVPVLITENGVGNYDSVSEDGKIHDPYRIAYLQGYVDWIEKAMEDGCDVRGYFVWSSMDLYSWINGYQKRYGLVYVDFDDDGLKRIPKDSYYWYRNTIKEKGEKFDEHIH